GPPLDGGGPQARASGRSAAAAARDRGAVVAQELARVDHGAVLPDLEVHVGTGRASGGTGLGHFLSGTDQVAALHHQARVVRVAGDVAVAMVDLDGLAVTAAVVGEADHAVGHGHHRVADVGVEVDALVELATAAERIGATAEAGGDVRTPHRRARRHRVGFQLHVEQQRFHHRELTSGGGKLALDLVEALDQLFLRHVTRDFGTTLARRSLEVELAVLELAGLGEALAEGVEAVGLGLEFTQARGQGVDLLLRLAADLLQLLLVARQFRTGLGGVGQAHAGAGTEAGKSAGGEENASQRGRALYAPGLDAAPQPGLSTRKRVPYDQFVAHALGMPDLKPNARRATIPRPAAEAALAGETGAPLRRALWLDALDQQLRPLLPPGPAAHCRLANVSGGQLVFVTDSPVWRARLRLAEAELLDAARSVGLNPTAVILKTTTVPLHAPSAPATSPPVSATALKAVSDALASLRDPHPGNPDGSGSTPLPGTAPRRR